MPFPKGKTGPQGLAEDDKMKIGKFFLKDEISWQAPGRKDKVIVRHKDDKGKKVKIEYQARYMLMSLGEAYNLFNKEDDMPTCSLSKFCELRPKHVLLFDKIPHNVCVCAYHENIRLMLIALKSHTSPEIPCDMSSFVDAIVCNSNSKECMTGACGDCARNVHLYKPKISDPDTSSITYSQWQDGEKVEIPATIEDALHELQRMVPSFLVHVYVKRAQASFFENVKESVDGVRVAVQVDFSENAALVHQNEIQSAHWAHKQATLFTSYAWVDKDVSESVVIVSDDLHHTKLSVHAFMSDILGSIKEKYPEVREFDIFSDGASSQFKQRFLFSNLFNWEEEFDVRIRWHFFATSHGKGVVDGLGGTVKRAVWRYVKSGKRPVVSPEAFSQVARERNPGISVRYIPASKIQLNKQNLEKLWSETVPVPNTHKLHSIQPHGPYHLFVGDTSHATKSRVQIRTGFDDDVATDDDEDVEMVDTEVGNDEGDTEGQLHSDDQGKEKDLNLGDWVVVLYDQTHYPGQITSFVDQEPRIQVKVMHQSGSGSRKFWKWPEGKSDEVFYFTENVVHKIGLPIPTTQRANTFTFDQDIV